MPAQEALARGLVAKVVAADQLSSVAFASAAVLGSKKALTFADNKRWINRHLRAALDDARAEHARHRSSGKP
jgi:enoyl-CoA hydratase/3-hydroxypropionyl-coenzyme A dehydratase